MDSYFIINKPYGVLSQFTREVPEHRTLGDLYPFPKDVYPVGRLDKDSEGLLILTNDSSINHKLLNPQKKHQRTYWVQVEGVIEQEAIDKLKRGVRIKVGKSPYTTQPAVVEKMAPPTLPERDPPVRFRKNVPTSWVRILLTEGKNRQVRKMCAAVGFPCLRLVRTQIESLKLRDLTIGEVQEIDKKTAYSLLNIS